MDPAEVRYKLMLNSLYAKISFEVQRATLTLNIKLLLDLAFVGTGNIADSGLYLTGSSVELGGVCCL